MHSAISPETNQKRIKSLNFIGIHQKIYLINDQHDLPNNNCKATPMISLRTDQILKDCIDKYNNYGLKPKLQRLQLSQSQKIIAKEKKRLGVKHPRITIQEIGLEEIKSNNNLFNLAQEEKLKITKICTNSHKMVTIGIAVKPNTTVSFTLEAGTLLFPNEQIEQSTQSLIIQDDLSTTVSECESELTISTFCFNSELRSPAKESFYLGNIKSNRYSKGMDQS